MRIAVYLGSTFGNDPLYCETAEKTGRWIASAGHGLVFGGSGVGMMEVLASAAYSAGAEVIGVIPRFMADEGRQSASLTRLIITDDMSLRRRKMIELSDGFVALPGGPGTLDEISEVISGMKLGLIQGRAVIVNAGGYYDALESQFKKMTECGFYPRECAASVIFVRSTDELDSIFPGEEK